MSQDWNITEFRAKLNVAVEKVGEAVAHNAGALNAMQEAWTALDGTKAFEPIVGRLKDIKQARRNSNAIAQLVARASEHLTRCTEQSAVAEARIEDALRIIETIDPTDSMPLLGRARGHLNAALTGVSTGIEATLVAPVGLESATVALGKAAGDIHEVIRILGH